MARLLGRTTSPWQFCRMEESPPLRRSPRYSTECLSDGRVPSSWKNASVVLIHKKGDTADIKNY